MDPGHLSELIELEECYWWHVAKRKLVIDILRREYPAPGILIEGGIGSARNLLEFKRMGYEVTGFDLMQDSVEYGRSRGLTNLSVHELSQPWPVAPASAKAIVLLDVMEHMQDPVQLLKNAAVALSEEGGIIITVPAYPSLYSSWDRKLGHYCRYTKKQFCQNVTEAGLNVKWVTHWNSFTLPAAILSRGADRVFKRNLNETPRFTPIPKLINHCLLFCAGLERKLINATGVPFGLSLIGVLIK
ncbi:MAG: class I SAM-dependent methyltransferase [Planctomycetaceae bacterium]|nr:class I SAM-dependent methyltransferase [Planctomycetaceae bacterium]